MRLNTRTLVRDITLQNASANVVEIDLPRGQLIHSLLLRWRGQIAATIANNVAANVQRGGPWSIIRNIRVIADGTDTIRDFSGADLRELNRFLNLSPVEPLANFGAGTADPTFDQCALLHFAFPKSFVPDDTLLDTRTLSRLTLRIEFGTPAEAITGATGYVGNPIFSIAANQISPVSSRADGDRSDPLGIYAPFRWNKQTVVTGAAIGSPGFQIKLPTGGLYRFLMIRSAAAATPNTDSDLITNISVRSGSMSFIDLPAKMIRDFSILSLHNPFGFAADVPDAAALTTATPQFPFGFRANNNSDVLANYYIDLSLNGQYSGGIDTRNYADLDLFVQTSANAVIDVTSGVAFPGR